MKRLADAERDGDRIYAVVRGMGASSDGKGKGITAPNPIGQKLAIERAWENAGLSPATATLIEGHGTSTSVGDRGRVREPGGRSQELRRSAPARSRWDPVKSNIGHLKGAAGAAGILKTALALARQACCLPACSASTRIRTIDFAHAPLYVNRELQPWTATVDGVRRAGVSAFGFGGTNFHAVLEEYVPHRLTGNGKRSVSVVGDDAARRQRPRLRRPRRGKAPLRGALVIGGRSRLRTGRAVALGRESRRSGPGAAGGSPVRSRTCAPPNASPSIMPTRPTWPRRRPRRSKALAADQPAVWKALRAQGIFRGQRRRRRKSRSSIRARARSTSTCSEQLREIEPIVARTFDEADRVDDPDARQAAAANSFSSDRTNPEAVARPRTICAKPRSRSRRCWRRISR